MWSRPRPFRRTPPRLRLPLGLPLQSCGEAPWGQPKANTATAGSQSSCHLSHHWSEVGHLVSDQRRDRDQHCFSGLDQSGLVPRVDVLWCSQPGMRGYGHMQETRGPEAPSPGDKKVLVCQELQHLEKGQVGFSKSSCGDPSCDADRIPGQVALGPADHRPGCR